MFRQQCADLERAAEQFLRADAEYCAKHQAVPEFLEATLGMPSEQSTSKLDTTEPVPIRLSDGRVIRMRGRVDRIDRVGGQSSREFAIWDYKTGSTYGYDRANPLREGRKLQPYLYVLMVRHRLREVIGKTADVSSFGFFFPGLRGLGERFIWTPEQLQPGDEILSQLCDLVAGGAFPATTNGEDCKYCDYAAICGDPEKIVAQSQRKLEDPPRILVPWRRLRPTKNASSAE